MGDFFGSASGLKKKNKYKQIPDPRRRGGWRTPSCCLFCILTAGTLPLSETLISAAAADQMKVFQHSHWTIPVTPFEEILIHLWTLA